MPKITKRTVDAAQADPGRRFYIWDDQIKGFGLLVLPSGVKSYIYQYRTPEGRERRATIGKHGSITPDEARDKADAMRRAVKEGRDPLAEKRERLQAVTVGDVLDAYLDSDAFAAKTDRTRATDKGRIVRHLKPLLGRNHVDTLRPGDVEKAFAAIRDGKTAMREKMGPRGLARVTGGEGAARKSVRLLRSTLQWAVRERMVKANPVADVRTGTDGTRDVILDDATAYGRLFQTLDRMENEKRIRQPVADAIRIIALTGARRGEITGMIWQHVDLKAGLVTLPPSGHKTGRKTGKPRVIGLPAAAQAIIARQPSCEASDFVFQPAKGDGPVSLSKVWAKVREEAKLPEGIGLHGLRHSLASHMAMAGAQASEIMTALGHRSITTSAKYVHWATDARQAVAEKAASVVLAGMDLPSVQAAYSGHVVPIKGGS
ncbi:site-specific recombinase XerD [Hoeflea sp. IMCC20628]|uniref:site-specific integrase n=1 Tax=Hoeflea sp. IMCC20628 TaxID=1620421 RepID=UPI00063AEB37|nr:site-specific integrase [Hoeflea sp. IMCC20628]AKI00558.1 site-specific recombinase XerD [Hoeflea sp. IMCC20628]